jgi:four helix bundle protein
LTGAATGIVANLREGFSQQTDRQFVRFLYYARGSTSEIRGHLDAALALRYLSEADVEAPAAMYEEISRMISGLIKYLKRSDRKHRGCLTTDD